MKSNQFFSGIALVGLAASVTAGSMYVTIAAAQQADSPVGSTEDASSSVPEAVVVQAASALERALAPDQVIHSRSHAVVLDSEGAFSGKLSGHFSGAEFTAASGMTVKVIQGGMEAGKAQNKTSLFHQTRFLVKVEHHSLYLLLYPIFFCSIPTIYLYYI